MPKKTIAILIAYFITLVTCFTVAFIDSFSKADGTGVLVGYDLPCEVPEVDCPSCSSTLSVSPPAATENLRPPVFYPEPCTPDAPWLIGIRRLIGMQMEECYTEYICIIDDRPRYYYRCYPISGCEFCEEEPNSVCYDVTKNNIGYLINHEMRIWKPTSED